jgi:transcriptional regulator with XRE-family HTH domain
MEVERVSNIGNKETFAKNLLYYLEWSGKNQKEVAEAIGVTPASLNEWTKAKKYPRIDKIEMLARYFGILKSDLIEEHTSKHENTPDERKLTEGEELLLQLFRQIPEDAQKMYLEVLRASLKNQSKD